MNTLLTTPKQNRLLAALPAAEYLRLEPELEVVSLAPGQVIYEAGEPLEYLYFPTAGIVSLLWTTASGATSELAMTGNDGLVGIPAVLGSETTTHRAVVQSPGSAYRIRSEVAHWVLDQGGELLHLVVLYAQALMTQTTQIALCNRHHSVEQQLCRWILLCLDRLPGVQLNTTQAMMAQLLGVRRVAVSEAAGKLQAAGLMTYSRGQITILDRPGLEARACECYAAMKEESDRLLRSMPNALNPPRVRPTPKNIRARAEKRLKHMQVSTPRSPADVDRLVHELQVRQIELELQNEEITNAYAEADAARARYADLYDFAPAAYVTLDALGAIRQINLSGAILLGIKRSQIKQHRFGASVSPAFLPAFNQFLAEVLDGRARKTCEIELNPTQQRDISIVQIEAVSDEGGQECRMVISDVTAQRHSEYALREREQYRRALLNNVPFLVWLKDDQGRFLAVNRPFAAQFGWPSAESLVGKTDFDIASEDLAEAYRADDRAILDSGKSKIVEEWIEDRGERRWSETFKSPVSLDGRVIGTVGFARDITARKQSEQELEHYRDHLEDEVSLRTLELAKANEIAELTSQRLRVSEERLSAMSILSQKATQLDERELWQLGIEEAVRLTESEIGYLHFVNDDQETLELCAWSQGTLKHCAAAYDSHYPVSAAGVWADSVRFRRPVIHNDYQALTERKGYPEGHAHLIRHIGVPVIEGDKVRVLMGVGNKATDYDATDVNQLQLIGNDLWLIVMRRRAEVALAEAKAARSFLNVSNKRI
jgi:PAS domain S-box-containing protein